MCSAAAPVARSGGMSETTPRMMQSVPGQLLLWDTKTVKQQVNNVANILGLRYSRLYCGITTCA